MKSFLLVFIATIILCSCANSPKAYSIPDQTQATGPTPTPNAFQANAVMDARRMGVPSSY